MSRSLPFKPSAITSALVVAWVAAACGHSTQLTDAYNAAKNGAISNGNTGNTGTGTAGSGNSSNGGSGNTAGSGTTLPQYSCTVADPQFDRDHMNPYVEDPAVTASVEATLKAMDSTAQASQMIGVPDNGDAVRTSCSTAAP
jgi:hypothetical protein